MHLISIGSSSSGNSTLVYNDDTSILIDAGVAVKNVLEKTGRGTFDALLITHEHSDHIKCAGALGRKTKTTIYVNPGIVEKKPEVFNKCIIADFDLRSAANFKVGSIDIKPFSTKHDAIGALGFVLEDSTTKFGYVTDTGTFSKSMRVALNSCNSIMLECDYDDDLLNAYADYSDELKGRIRSNYGHLSNKQAIEFIKLFGIDNLKTVIIGHLSQRTNNLDKLWEYIKQEFPDSDHQDKFTVAPFDGSIEI